MKKLLGVLLIFVSPQLWAHCPVPFVDQGKNLCMGVEWLNGDKKQKGKLETTDLLSPYLNKEGTLPQNWIYSRALIKIWADGDKTHVPVVVENFRVFPYMTMVDGMHHEASSQFSYDESLGGYVLAGFSMQEMEGCWSLRWSVTPPGDVSSGTAMMNISNYSNLTETENVIQNNLCDICTTEPTTVPDGSHEHHH